MLRYVHFTLWVMVFGAFLSCNNRNSIDEFRAKAHDSLSTTLATEMKSSLGLIQSPIDNGDALFVIAHRGVSGTFPENTLRAFEEAIKVKAEMVELDVSISKDGVPVVIHDRTVDRTTDYSGEVQSFTLAELKAMEVGGWFTEEYRGEPFPTLREALELMKGKIAVNIEIQTEAVQDAWQGGIVDKTVHIVKELDMAEQVIYSSFDYRVLEHLEIIDSSIVKALLYEASQSNGLTPSELVQKYRVDAFNCSYRQLSDTWIQDLNEHGIPYMVYTVNEEPLMRELIDKGVRGIFTDYPGRLLQIVENL
ncbi:MAG: glycerophosphodiester phosphodiesterase family protein [Bacteroidota bacterium]